MTSTGSEGGVLGMIVPYGAFAVSDYQDYTDENGDYWVAVASGDPISIEYVYKNGV